MNSSQASSLSGSAADIYDESGNQPLLSTNVNGKLYPANKHCGFIL